MQQLNNRPVVSTKALSLMVKGQRGLIHFAWHCIFIVKVRQGNIAFKCKRISENSYIYLPLWIIPGVKYLPIFWLTLGTFFLIGLRISQWVLSEEHKDRLFLPHISSDLSAPVLQINIAMSHASLFIDLSSFYGSFHDTWQSNCNTTP